MNPTFGPLVDSSTLVVAYFSTPQPGENLPGFLDGETHVLSSDVCHLIESVQTGQTGQRVVVPRPCDMVRRTGHQMVTVDSYVAPRLDASADASGIHCRSNGRQIGWGLTFKFIDLTNSRNIPNRKRPVACILRSQSDRDFNGRSSCLKEVLNGISIETHKAAHSEPATVSPR